jgi:hypothetical protein
MYSIYVNNFNLAVGTVRELRKLKEFEIFCKEKPDIDSLLILPIQRIPRYELLLDQMIKYTWLYDIIMTSHFCREHPDFETLNTALMTVKATAQYGTSLLIGKF